MASSRRIASGTSVTGDAPLRLRGLLHLCSKTTVRTRVAGVGDVSEASEMVRSGTWWAAMGGGGGPPGMHGAFPPQQQQAYPGAFPQPPPAAAAGPPQPHGGGLGMNPERLRMIQQGGQY